MRRFGKKPHEFFNSVYRARAPWDIGGPQPALVQILTAFPPTGPILDVGCGSGDLAIALAESGFDVVGVDIVQAAIDEARNRASKLPGEVSRKLDFQVSDITQPDSLVHQFGAVVDSGFYHLFEPDEAVPYIENIERALIPGGRYYLLAFAVEFDIPNVPRKVSESELRDRFSSESGWRIEALKPAQFLSRIAPVPAIAACMLRLDEPDA